MDEQTDSTENTIEQTPPLAQQPEEQKEIPNTTMEEQPQKREQKGGMIFLIVVGAIAFIALIYGLINIGSVSSAPITPSINVVTPSTTRTFNFKSSKKVSPPKSPYIANLYITGTIQAENQTYNQKWLLETIQELYYDPNNLGILLVIDSPGGTVYEADEAYLALEEYKNSGKTVWAYFASMAASGGYYIGCAADTIYANRNTLTGSIGVIAGSSIDVTEFLEKNGIKYTTFTAGKNKNMLNYNSPLTEEHRQIMQSVADDAYEQFTSIVAHARQKSIDEVKTLADGRIYTANQAKQNGLIDSIGSLGQTQDAMQAAVSKKNDEEDFITFFDYKYEYRSTIFNRFAGIFAGDLSPSAATDPLTKAALKTLAPDIKYPAYLYH